MITWFNSLLTDAECCTGKRPDQKQQDEPPHRRPSNCCVCTSRDRSAPQDEVFLKLGELCANDPQIARRIEDDRTCPIIWGKTQTKTAEFLQMCIRDNHEQCRILWPDLSAYDKREFMETYQHGPPSADYFLDIMVPSGMTGVLQR